jgi:hypothetical protein
LLSAISSNSQGTVNNARLTALAKAANINTIFELLKLIEVLQQQQLIDTAGGGIAVLGITTAKTLQHTSDIFDTLAPGSMEVATIALAELASLKPVLTGQVAVKLADSYRLGKAEIGQLMSEAEQIGLWTRKSSVPAKLCYSTTTCSVAKRREKSKRCSTAW